MPSQLSRREVMVALTVVGMDLRDSVEEGLAGELDMGSEGRGELFLQVCS